MGSDQIKSVDDAHCKEGGVFELGLTNKKNITDFKENSPDSDIIATMTDVKRFENLLKS